ncbi:hypothetical protein FHX64_002396 [Microbacter margulisiae]|uniref:Uncharacterized protein n=1 Tax=Microbacter margulisiae TaxID=1350067 RepID=A0A7W5DT00_9PORP|nr:hypothetical protein [Microbacter margulisiae]
MVEIEGQTIDGLSVVITSLTCDLQIPATYCLPTTIYLFIASYMAVCTLARIRVVNILSLFRVG